MRVCLFWVAVCCHSAMAGNVYKCTTDGQTTYSQTPCAATHEVIKPYLPPPNLQESREAIEAKCLKEVLRRYSFKDPDSAKVVSSEIEWLTDKSGVRQVMFLKVNAKNSFGGYAGAEPYPCFLSGDGQRLSDIQELVN